MATRIKNRIEEFRRYRGLSTPDLAKLIGVTRQSAHAMETGTYVPNTAVALKVARALRTTVDKLFEIVDEGDDGLGYETVHLLPGEAEEPGRLVQIAKVGDKLVASAPTPTPWYIPTADGYLDQDPDRARLFDPYQSTKNRLLMVGCDPGMAVLARHLLLVGVELVMVHRNSSAALELFRKDMVHIAGVHSNSLMKDIPALGNQNEVRNVRYAVWQAGICVPAGNPKTIRGIEDFLRPDVTIVNREIGAGARILLTSKLEALGVDPYEAVQGFRSEAHGHLIAAWHVANGLADACVATLASARAFGLGFLPLEEESYNLVFARYFMTGELEQKIHDTLAKAAFRREVEALGGYDAQVAGTPVID